MRQKAFTLFSSAYDEVRRAVTYLRAPFGDAEDITPTFFASRGGRRTDAPDDEPGTGNAPSEPPASGVTTPRDIDVDNSAGLPVTKPFTT